MNNHTAVPTTAAPHAPALQLLRSAVSGQSLLPLDPVEYARGHALFETRSDQRARLTAWLADRLAHRAAGPTRVLSIGCGDGTVDVKVAAALAGQGQHVEYVGVDPHAPSGAAFKARLAAGAPGVETSVLTADFVDARPAGAFDVVLAVHSLYYVADLATTVNRARALLAPGGELIVLLAPREPINVLVRLLAPGRPQSFSEDLAERLRAQGLRPEVSRVDGRLDLGPTGDPATDRRLLEFTVQARLTDALQAPVRAALAERALVAPGLVLAHPVDTYVLPAGPGAGDGNRTRTVSLGS